MKLSLYTVLVLSSAVSVVRGGKVTSLTDDNYERLTKGKTVFIKFFAPWCGYCKAIAGDWERLADDWEGNPVGLVAEVDCTAEESMELCDDGIDGFPTLKWGDPMSLEDYDGERDYESLAEFAKDNLKPMCTIDNLDLCDDETVAMIKKFQTMPVMDLNDMYNTVMTKIEDMETTVAEKIEELETQINDLINEYEKEKKKVKKESYMNYIEAVGQSRADELDALDAILPDDYDYDDEDDIEDMIPNEL